MGKFSIDKVRTHSGLNEVRFLNEWLFPADEFEKPEWGNIYWLVKDNHTTVGHELCGFASLRPTAYHPRWAFLSRSGIMPHSRRLGLHSRLIRVRVNYARASGLYDLCWTYCRDDNYASANSLIKQGFKLFMPYWGGGRYLYFKKELV